MEPVKPDLSPEVWLRCIILHDLHHESVRQSLGNSKDQTLDIAVPDHSRMNGSQIYPEIWEETIYQLIQSLAIAIPK